MLGIIPLFIKVLSLLFPTIPKFTILTLEKWWKYRFENTWAHIGPVYLPCIFKSILSPFFKGQNWKFWYRWKEETQYFYKKRFYAQHLTKTIFCDARGLAPYDRSWKRRTGNHSVGSFQLYTFQLYIGLLNIKLSNWYIFPKYFPTICKPF